MTDVSKGEPTVTVGLDLGDRYSYLYMLDTNSGEVIEEGSLRTTPKGVLPPKPSDGASVRNGRCASPSRREATRRG